MNRKTTPFLVVGLNLIAIALARADVYCTATSSNNSGSAEISYRTGSGFTVVAQGGAGGYSFNPDQAPGHQAFSLQTAISGSDLISKAAADGTAGTVRASSAGTGGIAGNRAQIFDEITFHNTTSQVQTVTIGWNVDGALSVGTMGRATYHADLRFDGPGTVLRFLADADLVAGRSDLSFANYSASGWNSYSCEQRSGGYGGVDCNGTWSVPPGDITLSFYGLIDTAINCTSAGCENSPLAANFGNTGRFSVSLPQGVSFTSNGGTLTSGSRMVNISTRAEVRTGDSVEIAGFIITGTAQKKVIIRGIGPSLASAGVSGTLADPVVELHRRGTNGSDTVVATNNNWKESQQSEIEATGIPPANEREAAIVRTLDPGNYTAVLRDSGGSSGVGLVEVYDLQSTVDSKLANISTRAFVNVGNNVLIGGIIGGGNGSQPKVLIRAIGPSLSSAGVADVLQDTVLELRDRNGALVIANDDWQSDQKTEIEATGVAPSNAKESAIIATLAPTNYTAIVRGKAETRGVGLVEVYHLQ